MWTFLKRLFLFRVGQKTSRSMARAVGLGRLGMIIGLVGGYRYMRRNARSY